MKTAFGLHLKIDFKSIQGFLQDIALLDNNGQKTIWLTGKTNDIRRNLDEINALIDEKGLSIISNITFYKIGIKTNTAICDSFAHISTLKKQYPSLTIGCVANDIADCKNIEHFKGDFVYFGPLEKIGTSPYITLSPEKPDYEWRFIDITIPIIAFGLTSSDTLDNLTKKANLFGFATAGSEFKNLNKTSYRFTNI